MVMRTTKDRSWLQLESGGPTSCSMQPQHILSTPFGWPKPDTVCLHSYSLFCHSAMVKDILESSTQYTAPDLIQPKSRRK